MERLGKTLVLFRGKNVLRIGILVSVMSVAYVATRACLNTTGAIKLSSQISVSSDSGWNNPLHQHLLAEPETVQENTNTAVSPANTSPDQELLHLLQNAPSPVPVASNWKVVRMRVTAYCTCPKCCGKFSDGVTADCHKIRRGDTFVAADKRYAFGTQMIIPGYSNEREVKVKDRGRLIKGNRLDVFFNNHKTAQKWGTRYLDVLVKEKP